jgi:hypothetical protein
VACEQAKHSDCGAIHCCCSCFCSHDVPGALPGQHLCAVLASQVCSQAATQPRPQHPPHTSDPLPQARAHLMTVQEQADAGKRVDWAAALSLLFKDIGLALEEHEPLVRDTFGPSAPLELASALQVRVCSRGRVHALSLADTKQTWCMSCPLQLPGWSGRLRQGCVYTPPHDGTLHAVASGDDSYQPSNGATFCCGCRASVTPLGHASCPATRRPSGCPPSSRTRPAAGARVSAGR